MPAENDYEGWQTGMLIIGQLKDNFQNKLK
jgi:hypothetical protein